MPDDLFEYLRLCGGRDTLQFDTVDKASAARSLLLDQLDEEGVPFDARPSVIQFADSLVLSLKDSVEVPLSSAVVNAR